MVESGCPMHWPEWRSCGRQAEAGTHWKAPTTGRGRFLTGEENRVAFSILRSFERELHVECN